MKIVPPVAHWLRLTLILQQSVRQVFLDGGWLGGLGEGNREHVAFCIHKLVVGVDFLACLGWLYSVSDFCVAFI
jgi:hypothetical protein